MHDDRQNPAKATLKDAQQAFREGAIDQAVGGDADLKSLGANVDRARRKANRGAVNLGAGDHSNDAKTIGDSIKAGRDALKAQAKAVADKVRAGRGGNDGNGLG